MMFSSFVRQRNIQHLFNRQKGVILGCLPAMQFRSTPTFFQEQVQQAQTEQPQTEQASQEAISDADKHAKKHQFRKMDAKYYENEFVHTSIAELEYVRSPFYELSHHEHLKED